MKIGICGSGQFAGSFAKLWKLHPDVEEVYATDLIPERASDLVSRLELAGTFPDYAAMLASDEIDAGRGADPALAAPRPGHPGPGGRQARLLRSPDGPLRGGDRQHHRHRAADRSDLHDGGDQLLQPRGDLGPSGDRARRAGPGVLLRGRLRARHGPRLLRRLPVQRGRELEVHRELPADALPHPRRGRRAGRGAVVRHVGELHRDPRRARRRRVRRRRVAVGQRVLQHVRVVPPRRRRG